MSRDLSRMRRIVVKIGSSLLADPKTGALNQPWLKALGDDLARLKTRGQDIVVVSSGAIALGRASLGLGGGTLKLDESQAAAAIGQITLAHAYRDALAAHDLNAAQILLTLNDTEERRRYLNARSTLQTLLKLGAVPIVNENDTVATSEIRYGDNDRLAARVAGMISADCLVLLSDIDGFYTKAPASGGSAQQTAQRLDEIHDITAEIAAMAGGATSNVGSGGMVTKLEAARIATRAGAHMVIAKGDQHRPLEALENGANCTWFVAAASPAAARKRWIAGTLEPCGKLQVDAGAAKALQAGKSLLPAGVIDVSGEFAKGDALIIVDGGDHEIARGLSAYDSPEAARIAGHKSSEIEEILGYRGRNELIHRDDLILTAHGPNNGLTLDRDEGA